MEKEQITKKLYDALTEERIKERILKLIAKWIKTNNYEKITVTNTLVLVDTLYEFIKLETK